MRTTIFQFQSLAVQWMARTSSLNCLSCRNPYQAPDPLNCLPLFHWKPLFFTEKCSVASPSDKSAPNKKACVKAHLKNILSNPRRFYRTPSLVGSRKRFYRTPVKGSSEPQTGFYRTFRIEPPLFRFRLPLYREEKSIQHHCGDPPFFLDPDHKALQSEKSPCP